MNHRAVIDDDKRYRDELYRAIALLRESRYFIHFLIDTFTGVVFTV